MSIAISALVAWAVLGMLLAATAVFQAVCRRLGGGRIVRRPFLILALLTAPAGLLSLWSADPAVVILAVLIIEVTVVVCWLLVRLGWYLMVRGVHRRIVLGHLAAAVRQNLPLATSLALAAESESGAPRRVLEQLASLLGQGLALSEALRSAYPDCPSLVVTLVAAGERSGRLLSALEQAEGLAVQADQARFRPVGSVWPYVLSVTLLTVTLVGFLLVAVVPRVREAFLDFETELPVSTVLLIRIAEVFVEGPGLAVPVIAAVALFLGIYLKLKPRRVPEPGPLSRLADRLRWSIPGLRRLQFGFGMGVALRTMQHAVAAGLPLHEAAGLACDLDVNIRLRERLRRFADMLAKGTTAVDAARACRLGSVAVIALGAGTRGDMAGALRYAADYHASVGSRLWIAMRSMAWPLATLAMATLVGFVVYAMFAPLAVLMEKAGGWVF